jgi:hypothetical protein
VRPDDEHTHPAGPEPDFHESMYFHFYDPAARLGGFARLAHRPNQGRGAMTVCLYLPGGRVGLAFARPPVTSNDTFDGAGLRFEVVEPLRRLDVSYAGRVAVLDDPRLLVDPRSALAASPRAECTITLAFRGMMPVFEHSFDAAGERLAPNHYQQLMSVSGSVWVGGRHHSLRGHGLRAHSWGFRRREVSWSHRWIHGCADGFGFMSAQLGHPSAPDASGGFVWDGRSVHALDTVAITTERNGFGEQDTISADLRAGTRQWVVHGQAGPRVPLRYRHTDADGGPLVTRIVEGLTTWSLAGGPTLHGMSEYRDELVEELPAHSGRVNNSLPR